MDPRLEELIEEGEGAEEVEVILKLRQGDIAPPHVRIITQFGDIATCRLRRDQIRATWEHPSTVSVKGSRYVAAEPEFVEGGEALDSENHPSDSRRPDSMEGTGRNVVIGIVDWGLDFGHLNFRRDDGSTRLLALWDQGNTTAIEKPAPYGYGAVYSPDEINRALQSPRPYETLGYHPADSDPLGYGTHGTHVCDIAAGNGRVEGSPLGIAPEADIVFVHLAARGTGGLANLGDSVRILEALDFIARIAGNRPWVVNLSLGRCGGPHTGLTLVEQGMDALLLQAPGRAICMSTGNYFDERVHTAGQLRPGQKHTLTWWTNKADITPNELECWYSGHDVFAVEVRPPEGNAVFHVPLGEQRSIQSDDKEVGRIYHRARDPGMGDNHIDIFLYPGAPAGSWLVTLIGEDIVDGRFHCWVERDNPCPQCQSRFDPQDAVPTSTIGTICNGFRTIAVGAYNHHSPNLEVAIFSSSGPTADGRQKPDLIAPGVRILAARSSSRDQHRGAPMLTRKSGTSMASPHVTGTLACMFEAAQRPLWIHETRKFLLSTCTAVSGPPEIAVRMGNGYLDIKKAVDAARIFTNEEQNSDRKIGKDVVMNGNDEYSRGEELEDEFFNEKKEGEDEEYEEYVEEDDEYGETSKERNFILISGGPGLFDNRDVEHDKSWANYVTPPLLMTDTEEKRKKFAQDDEEVWWFVYKPAYESRWDDDLKQGRKSTKEVKDKGFTSYVNLIEKRAKDRGWNLRWLNAADDLWKRLKTFSKGSISRVWYWGHARDDLWLSLGHSAASVAVAPEAHEIILASSIDGNKKLRDRFQKGNSKRIHRFVGCNTSVFAQAWSKAFKVWTEGVEEKVDFSAIHKTGGEPSLVENAKIKFFSPKGIEADPTEAWQVEFAAAEDSWTEESDDELFEAEEDNNEETEVSEICECKDDEEQDDEVFPKDMKNFDGELVALADEAISAGKGFCSPGALLNQIFSDAAITETLSPLGAGSFPSAAEIFDAFASGGSPALRRHFDQFFEVVALPGSIIEEDLHPGDLQFRRALGEGKLAHISVIASPELWGYEELLSKGLIPEIIGPGKYAQVVETGARPHTLSDAFARRVTDAAERLPHNQLVLRTRENVRQRIAESRQMDEGIMPSGLFESFSDRIYPPPPAVDLASFMPFELNGKPHFLAYNIHNGQITIYRIRPGARPDPVTKWPWDVIYFDVWSLGWTHFMPFKLSGDTRTHYLAYKAKTGEVRINRIKTDGKGVDTIWGTSLDPKIKWATDWTHFMPFTLGGQPCYLAHQSTTGEKRIDRIKADGKGVDTLWTEPLPQGSKMGLTFMPFELNGMSHFLYYNGSAGNVSISRIKPDGKGADVIWGTPFDYNLKWAPGWTHFMPFTLDGKPHYLAYMPKTGEVRIDRIKPGGKGADTIWGTPLDPSLKWAPDWTAIMPFRMEGKPHYLAYSRTTGWVETRSIAEELRRCVSPGVSRSDPTALNLSPVGTDDFKVTLTISGTSYEVKGNVFYPGKSNGAKVPFNTSAVSGGKAPIVFIAHGNHAIFHDPAKREYESGSKLHGFVPIANHRGYEYLQQLLAQMGVISVSVDCNQFSGFIWLTKANIESRAGLVLGAIKHFQSLDSGGDPTFGSHIDFSSVGLMGHSRGGEVVLRVPELLAMPSTGIKNVKVKGVLSIAPTDIGATSGPPTGFAFMTILPAADLDVIPNDGAKFYDRASANPFKCQLYIHDANHNFFNTEWVSDDPTEWDPGTGLRINPRNGITVMDKDDQKATLKAYGCAFFRTVLAGHGRRLAGHQMIKFIEGLDIPPGVARFRDIHISFERTVSTTVTVDDNEDHDIRRNALGKLNSWSGGLSAEEVEFTKTPSNTFFGNTRGMKTRSSTAAGRFRWELDKIADLTGKEIRIRTAEVYDGASVPVGATGFKLGLEDKWGKMGFVDSDDVGGLPRPYDRRADDLAHIISDHTKTMLKTLRFPVSCISRAEPSFKATNVRAILVQMDRKDVRELAFDQLQIV